MSADRPVRLVHLGLGNFFRAHQAFYTDRAPDAAEWGYAAFAGWRNRELPRQLTAQGGRYTLVTRGADADRFDLMGAVVRAHTADEHEALLGYFADPGLAVVTLTVTEAGYVARAAARRDDTRRDAARLDVDRPELRADLAALRADLRAPVRTAPARLVAGLAARRRADAGPLALVPCDNVPGNGALVAGVVRELAEQLDPSLAEWLAGSLSVVTTAIDRITPRSTPEDAATVRRATGFADACPVVTEPFTEWVLGGAFPAGRPAWHDAGATFADDVTPFEQRKLWLLNGAHSLLAYAGSIRGHLSVSDAIADDELRGWVEQWWATARAHLGQPEAAMDVYCAALVGRWTNTRIGHQLVQIGEDGSQKLPIRLLEVLRAERAAGRLPEALTRIAAAWICCLRGLGAPVVDVRAEELIGLAAGPLPQAVRRVLAAVLGDEAAEDRDVIAAVIAQCTEFGA